MTVSADLEGFDRLVGTLEVAADDLAHLDLSPIGVDLVAAAVPRTRVKSGKLRDTVRASIVDDVVILEAGGAGVDYAGIVHAYDPWLADTIATEAADVVDLVNDQVDTIVQTIQGV